MASRNMFMRNLVYMNGGALVALLGAMAENTNNVAWSFFPMVFFSFGLTLGALLNGMVYRQMYKQQKAINIFHALVVEDEINFRNIDDEVDNIFSGDSQREDRQFRVGVAGLVFFILGCILVFILGAVSLGIIPAIFEWLQNYTIEARNPLFMWDKVWV